MENEPRHDDASPITLCTTCVGAEALASDIEELCALVDGLGAPVLGGCLNHCSKGPNCMVGDDVLLQNNTFEKSLDVVQKSLKKSLAIEEEQLRNIRLKSDALRLMECGPQQDLTKAVKLLSEAIVIEQAQTTAATRQRLCNLRVLRANACASSTLSNFEDALADLDAVLVDRPGSARTLLDKAKILRRARRPADALTCFSKALEHGMGKPREYSEKEFSPQERKWIQGNIDHLTDVVQLGHADGSDATATDSGDGSGRWKVVKITGTSFDTCIYHLENHPPAVPHPYAGHAWHVSVRFGSASRDYTPISTVKDWEQGRLELLVKTYVDGEVSKKFAMLQPFSLSQGAAWVTITVPKLTLTLPGLLDGVHLQEKQHNLAIKYLGLVVGGTGIVPALQILREVAKGAEGPFSLECKAMVIYASRRAGDVLALDELREVEANAAGRIVVWHTLTEHYENQASCDTVAQQASAVFSKGLSRLPCKHSFFASFWKPCARKFGPLRTGIGEEAGLRGRPTAEMLSALLPKPSELARTVVCGPPQMWEDVRQMLLSLGHCEDRIIELKALSAEQLLHNTTMTNTVSHIMNAAPTSRVNDVTDVGTRIEAAKQINDNEESLRLKASIAMKPPVPVIETKRDAWSYGGWNSWKENSGNAWGSSSWGQSPWKASRWQ